jgi:hypothetical protein
MKKSLILVLLNLITISLAQTTGWLSLEEGKAYFNGDNTFINFANSISPGRSVFVVVSISPDAGEVDFSCQNYIFNGLNDSAYLFDYINYSTTILDDSIFYKVILKDIFNKPFNSIEWSRAGFNICQVYNNFEPGAVFKGKLLSKSSIQIPRKNLSLPIFVPNTKGVNRGVIKAKLDEGTNSLFQFQVVNWK